MKMKVSDALTVEQKHSLVDMLLATDGYCPCKLQKTDDNKCPCKSFRDSTELGACHCGFFTKVEV